ncbi:MAG: hypothetical protein NT123_20190 [Proteobacteria bacterium]|nr:hypothetical protein [Pseudomonadota bacterium]
MKTASLPAMLHGGSAALARALEDPVVARLARSMNLDLRDPATLNKLLAMTQQHADSSAEVSLGQRQALAELLVPGQSRYARDAIRTYMKIAAMNDRMQQVQ